MKHEKSILAKDSERLCVLDGSEKKKLPKGIMYCIVFGFFTAFTFVCLIAPQIDQFFEWFNNLSWKIQVGTVVSFCIGVGFFTLRK